ncbi:MAG TPA: glycosyltransferase [Bacteroidia bacterium]|nr:glycosyltransferase [Bacteroidia bacterium]
MKILYISYDGMTDPLGQSQVIPYLIGLSQKNKITIISCEKKDRFEKQKVLIQQQLDQHQIGWIPVSYSSLPSILSKQWNIMRMKKKAIAFCKMEHPEIVHCRSYMAALIGLLLKKKFNTRFIFDMRGFWVDERIEGNIWSQTNFIHRKLYSYFKKKEIQFLQHADYTITLTENAKKEILSWQHLQSFSVPIEVIPCCADLEHFSIKNIQQSAQQQLEKKLAVSEDDFIITYLGSIGTWYLLDEMLDFFLYVMKQFETAKFLFITQDSKAHILEKAAAKGIKEERLIICAASRGEVPLYLSLSKIAVYFIRPTYSKKASSPTKTAEILGMGIPIVTNSGIGDSDLLLKNPGTGVIIDDFRIETYIKAVNRFFLLLSSDKNERVELSHTYFSLNRGIELYQSVYNKITEYN